MKRDTGRKETDKLLEDMEKQIAKEYAQAAREMEEKLYKYMQDFQRKEANKLRAVADGEITEAEYRQWRINQVLVGNRWIEMRDTLVQDMQNTNKIARSIVNGYMPQVYALNHNYGAYEVEKGSKVDTGYTLYSRETVERMMREDPELLPPPGKKTTQKILAGKEKRWERQQVRSVMTQAVLQGESMPKIAKRLENAVGKSITLDDIKDQEKKTSSQIAKELAKRNKAAAIRNARTMTTGAENAGRADAYMRAKNLGIDMKVMWLATLDGRTRDSHRDMDGEEVEVGELFSNGLRFPGDPHGPGEEVYNCRCTTVAQLAGFETDAKDLSLRKNNKLGDMTYEEWKENKRGGQSDNNLTKTQNDFIKEYEKYSKIANPTEDDIKRVGKALRARMMERYEGIEDYETLKSEKRKLRTAYVEVDDIERKLSDTWNEIIKCRMFDGKDVGRDWSTDVMNFNHLRRFEEMPEYCRSRLKRIERRMEEAGITVDSKDTVFDVLTKVTDLSNKLGKDYTDKYNEYKALHDRVAGRGSAEALKQELALVRSMGITSKTDMSTHFITKGKMKNAIVNAYDFFPTDWIQGSIDHGRILPGVANRGYYRHWEGKVVLHHMKNDDPDSVLDVGIHELSHRFERTQKLIPLEKEFYERRTQGEALEWLGPGYARDEKTRKDKFVSKYMGKDYAGTAYELQSMGNEYAYTNPAELLKDPDMADWIYGILAVR